MRYLSVLLLAGCASTGVVSTGTDTYMIGGKAKGLGASGHDASADLYREANAYCGKQGRKFEQISVQSRDGGFARFPNAKLEFRCVPK